MNKDLTIKFIKEACINRKIFWTKHVMERMGRRGIYKADIISCIISGKIIEEYPGDFPFPSCLIFGYTVNDNVVHVVLSYHEETITVITAYFPNFEIFKFDLKTRR